MQVHLFEKCLFNTTAFKVLTDILAYKQWNELCMTRWNILCETALSVELYGCHGAHMAISGVPKNNVAVKGIVNIYTMCEHISLCGALPLVCSIL